MINLKMKIFSSSFKISGFFPVLLFYVAIFSQPLFASPSNIRNTVQAEQHSADVIRDSASHLLFLPRQITNGTLWGIEKTASALSDPDFIETVKDVLYLYERELLWFPIVSYESGFRPSYGAGLYYHRRNIKALLRGQVHDSRNWSYGFKASYVHPLGSMYLKTSFSGIFEKQDDLRYYGIGADPENDARNGFISAIEQDYGVYTEDRRKLQWKEELIVTDAWKVRYLGYYQRRAFDDEGRGDNPLRDVFNLSLIPGFTTGAPVSQIYNEVSVVWDNRSKKEILSQGFRLEAYTGISSGIQANPSDFLRVGFDAAAFVPVIKENRVVIPRITIDVVEDLNSHAIPFTEYPRHHHFRGVSQRDIIHNDDFAVSPSIEYQWPLSHMLIGHLFFDVLAVGDTLGDVDFKDALWAVGGGVNLHLSEHEIAKVSFAGGSEGFQLGISIGLPLEENEREDW